MSVCFRITCADGVTGGKITQGCWGSFKSNLQQWAVNNLKKDYVPEYDREVRNFREYHDHLSPTDLQEGLLTRLGADAEEYKKRRLTMQGRSYNTPLESLATGITHITLENVTFDVISYNNAFDTLLAEYPKLFEGVEVDKGAKTITFSMDQHYAILYNQLRILKLFCEQESSSELSVLRDAVANPELSFLLLAVYPNNYVRLGDSAVIYASGLDMGAISRIIEERDWLTSEEDRVNPKFNALALQTLHKQEGGRSYAQALTPVANKDNYMSDGGCLRTLPKTSKGFIKYVKKGRAA